MLNDARHRHIFLFRFENKTSFFHNDDAVNLYQASIYLRVYLRRQLLNFKPNHGFSFAYRRKLLNTAVR